MSRINVAAAKSIHELMWMLVYRERMRGEHGPDRYRDKEIEALEYALACFADGAPEEYRVATEWTDERRIGRKGRRDE